MTNVLEDRFCISHEVRAMPRLFALIVCLLAAAASSGCQCFSATEKYGDFIDNVNDHSFCLDRFYKPTFDLTRIGHSDWCRSPLNRAWCSLGCRDTCCSRCAGEIATECTSCTAQWVEE